MNKLKILIVSTFFPPQNSIASLRPYSWAKYWAREGHDVTVLTTTKSSQLSDSPMQIEGFRVIDYPVPFMDFFRLASGLIFKKGNKDDIRVADKQLNKMSIACSIKNYINSAGCFVGCRMPDVHDLWAIKAFYRLPVMKWDCVVSTGGPYSVHYVGYYAKKHGLAKKWLMDWRDLWTQSHIFPGIALLKPIEKLIEKKFHKMADFVTTVSDPLAHQLMIKYRKSVEVIYNGFDPEEYQSLDEKKIFPDDGKIRIVYTGSIYPGKQDPSSLLEAICILDSMREIAPNKFEVVFAGNNANPLLLARKYNVEKYCVYKGFVPRMQALKMQKEADLLLFLEWGDASAKGILTGKLFEYLFAGPPILSIGGDEKSTTSKLITRDQRGLALGNNVDAIVQILREVINGKMIEKKIDGKEFFWQFTRQSQARKMLQILQE